MAEGLSQLNGDARAMAAGGAAFCARGVEGVDEVEAVRKERELLAALGMLPELLVAFSGGADSAYLAWAAHQALGERATAITAVSLSYSEHDREIARKFVERHGIRHEWIETREAENPLYIANNPDRCYHCKDELFARMSEMVKERTRHSAGADDVGLTVTYIAYGINSDDTRDFRPGHRAAAEHQVLAPLLDAKLNKAEIRWLSRRTGLETWDRPASACLSSRVPYGTAVTAELLRRIEKAEAAVRGMGFGQLRVRASGVNGADARVEIAREELERALEPAMAREIGGRVASCGFAEVSIDPRGYRQGSLNEVLRHS
jgi:pyridinium-3,5-biscarboxylic acid mononucleotide sulfurtransferase